MSLRTEVVGLDRLDDIRRSWIEMLPHGRWAFFMHPDWCGTAWAAFAPRATVHLHLAYEGNELVGILPVCHRRMNKFGLFMPVAEALAGARGDYTLPVLRQDAPEHTIPLLLDSALKSARSAGALLVANAPDETGVPARVEQHLHEQGLAFRRTQAQCMLLTFPQGAASADAVLPSRRRNDVKRQMKRVQEEVGPLAFRVATSPDEAVSLLPAFFEMHDRRWLEAGYPGSFGSAAARDYYHQFVRRLWDAGVHFSVTTCGEEPISFHLGAIAGGELLYYKPTYDSRLARYSPGAIHFYYLVQHALEQGLTGVDFLQGDEPYKRQWTNAACTTSSFLVQASRRTPTYFWLGTGREWAERRLGPAYLRTASWIESRLKR